MAHRSRGAPADSGASVEVRFAAAEQPDDAEAEGDAGDRREGGSDRRVADALAVDQEDDRADEDGADHGAEEGADDPLPEAVGQEDGEVPEGDAHREEDQESHLVAPLAHRRPRPLRRWARLARRSSFRLRRSADSELVAPLSRLAP